MGSVSVSVSVSVSMERKRSNERTKRRGGRKAGFRPISKSGLQNIVTSLFENLKKSN